MQRMYLALLLLLVPVTSGCQQSSKIAEVPAEFRTLTVSVGNKRVDLPATRVEIFESLGPADRVAKLANNIHTWDSIGVFAYQGKQEENFKSFVVQLSAEPDFDFAPKSNFSGTVSLSEIEFSSQTTAQELRDAGFVGEKGEYIVSANGRYISATMDPEETKLLNVEFDWSE